MAGKSSTTVAAIAAAFMLALLHVTAEGGIVPARKTQLKRWFRGEVASGGSMDPALKAAQASPAIIRVNPGVGGCFNTITDAVNSIPSENNRRVMVWIAGGVYREKLTIDRSKPFVTLLGSPGSNVTLVADGDASEYGTVDSATLIVASDYFMAVNINIKNSSPLPGETEGQQAVALRISGDKAAFYGCRISSYQDTLCDDKGRHLFKNCYIEGTVDFIFGSGKSLYLNSVLYVMDPGVITAHAREADGVDTGFSFVHCTVVGTATNATLGRAWMSHPITVFAYTQMSNVIGPQGWSDNSHPERHRTVFYGEYKNYGVGADTSNRAGFTKVLSDAQVQPFISLDYIDGAKWVLLPPQI